MWKLTTTALSLLIISDATWADDGSSPNITQNGKSYIADYGAACMIHNDKTWDKVEVCLRKFRVKSPLRPLTNREKYTKCHGQLKIDEDGNVAQVKIKKFSGIRALEGGCQRTLYALKFHPIRKEGAVGLKVKKVDFSLHYRRVKIDDVLMTGLKVRAYLGDAWDIDDSVFEQSFRHPILTSADLISDKGE